MTSTTKNLILAISIAALLLAVAAGLLFAGFAYYSASRTVPASILLNSDYGKGAPTTLEDITVPADYTPSQPALTDCLALQREVMERTIALSQATNDTAEAPNASNDEYRPMMDELRNAQEALGKAVFTQAVWEQRAVPDVIQLKDYENRRGAIAEELAKIDTLDALAPYITQARNCRTDAAVTP